MTKHSISEFNGGSMIEICRFLFCHETETNLNRIIHIFKHNAKLEYIKKIIMLFLFKSKLSLNIGGFIENFFLITKL